ncbi:MAG TPA: MFS transporter [Candidatus Methylomirabilis sp.]|nr:MFS transporter [Candidatus Methylomirabilis sp.]
MDTRHARAKLVTACAAHFLHDGFTDLLFVLFPVWARAFSLSFAEVGLLKTCYSGAMALFQVPAGLLAERWGEARLLAAGTALVGAGFLLLGTAGGFGLLLVFLLTGGLGASVQHPLGSSLVSRAYEEGSRRVALGTYNFSGDFGKMVLSTCAGLVVAWAGWRIAVRGVGLIALAAALMTLVALRRLDPPAAGESRRREVNGAKNGWGIKDARGFRYLSAIHSIDNGTRSAFLTYLPFLLVNKGAGMDMVGLALGLTFTGGAVGKFVCGAAAERLGIIRSVVLTEAATALGICGLLILPLRPSFFLLPILGIALNGTSSVLYGTVAELVVPERRSRAYGLFYTVGIGSGAAMPPAFGLLSDWAGLSTTLGVMALLVFTTIPLAQLLRPALLETAAPSPR